METVPPATTYEDVKAFSDNVPIEIENAGGLQDVDNEAERKVVLKTDLVLVPMLCLLLIVAFLDRTNIGNAKIQGMVKDLDLTGSKYNIALFMFFVPYLLLDVPWNMIMQKLRPSHYLSALMFAWGVVTIGEGVTKTYGGLVGCRVLLGALEAGYFPGAIYLLAMYSTRYELHRRMNIYYAAGSVSSAFGGLLAYAIGHMKDVGGYSSWRWIFILEGIVTIVVAVLTFFVLPDWPEQAKYLNDKERAILLRRLARDTKEYVEDKSTWQVFKDCLKDPKVYFSALMYFGTAVTGSSSSYFLPSILLDLGWTSLKAQYMTIPIWLSSVVTSIMIGFASDATNHRWGFCVGPLVVCVIGYIILLAQEHVVVGVRYMALFFIINGCYGAITISLTWLNNNIVGSKRRGISTAIMLAFGNCGSILGSNVYLSNEAPLYRTGYSVSLAMIILTMIAATGMLLYLRYENKVKAEGKRDHLLALPQGQQDSLGDRHPAYRYAY